MHTPNNTYVENDDKSLIEYFLATRPMFLTVSVFSVFIGTALGYRLSGQFDGIAMLLALGAVICVHAAVNVFNDVFDDLNGTDRINTDRISPFTGGSRFIQDGIIDIGKMRLLAFILLIISGIFGEALIFYKGPVVLYFGLAGIFLGLAYSAPPLKLASRGLGELAVAIGFGVLPIVGAAWLQHGSFNWLVLLVSIPVSLWVANILIINEVPDTVADGASGKNTLVVRFGNTFTSILYLSLNLLACAAVVSATIIAKMPLAIAPVPVLLLIPAIYSTLAIKQWAKNPHLLVRGIKSTLVIHALGCGWLLYCLLAIL